MNHHRTPPLTQHNGPEQVAAGGGGNMHPISAANPATYYTSGSTMCPGSHTGMNIVSSVIGSSAPRTCAGCGGKIIDRFLLHSLDRYWHTSCLKCSCCQATLADIGSSCFTRSGMILCKQDYVRMFGNSGACSACGQAIPPSELVMRAQNNVYHLKCFSCVKCTNQLVPGDRFNVINGSLLCEQDCLKLMKSSVATNRKGKSRINSTIKV